MNFDDPKPESDKRKQQLIYLRPSLKARIDAHRAVRQESRSVLIERAVMLLLSKEKTHA
jgi:hypothetical protein